MHAAAPSWPSSAFWAIFSGTTPPRSSRFFLTRFVSRVGNRAVLNRLAAAALLNSDVVSRNVAHLSKPRIAGAPQSLYRVGFYIRRPRHCSRAARQCSNASGEVEPLFENFSASARSAAVGNPVLIPASAAGAGAGRCWCWDAALLCCAPAAHGAPTARAPLRVPAPVSGGDALRVGRATDVGAFRSAGAATAHPSRAVRVVPLRVHDHHGDLAADDEGHDDHRRARRAAAAAASWCVLRPAALGVRLHYGC